MRETGERFERPAAFRIGTYLDSSFHSMRGDAGCWRVKLRFTGEAVRYVKLREWHPTQRLKERRDGSLEMTLEVSHLLEVRRWVLGYGPQCEVLAPAELRNRCGRNSSVDLRCTNRKTKRNPASHIKKPLFERSADMDTIDLLFPVVGSNFPCDHAFGLYTALSRIVPEFHHKACNLRIASIRGAYVGRGLLQVDSRISRLRLRLASDNIRLVLRLAGKAITLGTHRIRLGVSGGSPLMSQPNLIARMVVIKASSPRTDPADNRSRDQTATKRYLDPLSFREAVCGELTRRGIQGQVELPAHETGPRAGEPQRRILRIHGKAIVGFSVNVRGLSVVESIRLQEEGLGGRGKMGCGFFVPLREGAR